MKTKHVFRVLLAVCIVSIMFVGALAAKTFRDDFDDKELSDLWVVKVEGGASYEIDDGQLIQTSPGVADGINFIYDIPLKGDVTCEVKVDASELDGNYGHLGFFDEMLAPMVNTDMHLHWVDVFYCDKDEKAGILNDGQPAANWNRVIPHAPIDKGWHVWKIEVKGKNANFFIDGKLEAEDDTIVTDRYFIISVDPYTTHYFGTCTIEYVELTGESVVSLAVESKSKLATTWGALKAQK